VNILEVRDLSVYYDGEFSLDNISFDIKKGQCLCIVGESGSGKSTLAKAIANIFDSNAKASGSVFLKGKDILRLSQKEMKEIRLKEVANCFQSSKNLLNPMTTLKSQLYEVLERKYVKNEIKKHSKIDGKSRPRH